MNEHSYPGREYLKYFKNLINKPDVIIIGKFNEIDPDEDKRCGGLWNPPHQISFTSEFNFFYFESLKSESLFCFLKESNYDLGVQGGTGILKKKVIDFFKMGILNFNPGDLPEYRGCSAPEWQLFEGKPLIVTCHLLDEGIDSGNIVIKRTLETDYSSYQSYRASVYPLIGKFIYELFMNTNLLYDLVQSAQKQDSSISIYRKYIGDEKIKELENRLSNGRFKLS